MSNLSDGTVTSDKEYLAKRKKKNLKQRAKYGVGLEDEFSLDYYIASILLHSLPKYKNDGKYGKVINFTHSGTKYNMFADNSKKQEKLKKKAMLLWDMKIDAIWSALYDIYEEEEDFSYTYSLEGNERLELALKELAVIWRGLWW